MSQILFSLNSVSEENYPQIARALSEVLKPTSCLALHGDLGAGKTSFARRFIQYHLEDHKLDVPSPTFTLAQHYPSVDGKKPDIWHYDFYRIENESEADEIGFEENLDQCISIVEWPEEISNYLPANTLFVQFSPSEGNTKRTLTFIANNNWENLLNAVQNNQQLSRLVNQ